MQENISLYMDLNEGVSGSLIKKYKTTTGIPILNLKDNQLIIDGYIDITKTIKIHKYKKNDILNKHHYH